MAKRLAKKQRAPTERRSDTRDARYAKTGKQNSSTDKIIDDFFFERFEQISQQYELVAPRKKRGLRFQCMYKGLLDAIANAAIEGASKSMSREQLAKMGEDLARGMRNAFPLLTLWSAKAGSTPLKLELTKGQSRQAAEIAAQDVKANPELISLFALEGDERFFIYLGKYLSGEMVSSFPDSLDRALWRILWYDPSIKSPDAVRELKKQGWTMTEEAFRMRKKRFGFREFKRFSRSRHLRKA
jgi:hypothetical protein